MFSYVCDQCKATYTTKAKEPEWCVPMCMKCYAKEEMSWSLSIGKYKEAR